MRIELQTYNRLLAIDTTSPELAARWFTEQVPLLLNLNQSLPSAHITVYWTTEQERQLMVKPVPVLSFSEQNLRVLAECFTSAADRIKTRRDAGDLLPG